MKDKRKRTARSWSVAISLAILIYACLGTPVISGEEEVEIRSQAGRGEVRVVVVDPGHGGRDPGAVGPRGVLEKNLVLAVSLKLKEKLDRKGFEVILTRDKDVFIPLSERAEIANKAKADVFLSVHANGSRRGGWGFETYFLSATASDDEARRTALFENGLITFDKIDEGELPAEVNSDLEAILLDMAQTEYIRESESLAVIIQDQLDTILNTPNRGVKQAPFYVLMGAAMPAALVEIGFVSSRKEAKLLVEPEMQDRIAKTLAKSVNKFAEQRALRMGLTKESASANPGG